MCGISGSINLRRSLESRVELVKKMISCMNHRGPDTNDIWFDEFICLGHNRLSIIDLSENGKQPMHKGDWVITYNGEIYNYLELRRELADNYNVHFVTRTDTEVILSAWEIWGVKALNKFRGMWAFAIYNKRSHELYLCRDRFGIKPLYYYDLNGEFIFASEIKAIFEDENVARRAKLTTVVDFLIGFSDHSDATFFENIYQIQPGCYMYYELHNGSKEHFRYYDLAKATEGKTSTIEEFSKALEESVLLHLRSDVPVGTCLSGGLDSSSIATLAGRYMFENYGKEFHAVTAFSEDPMNDESKYAREVAKHSSLIWYSVKPSVDDFLNNWEKCQWFQDEPVGGPSAIMQFCLMQVARDCGLRVMLDGQGGDEALLGYERYYCTYFLDLIKQGKPVMVGKEFYRSIKNSGLSAPQMIQFQAYFLITWLRVLRQKRKWNVIPKCLLEHGLHTLQETSDTYKSVKHMQIAEITKYQLPRLLKYEDRNSMAWSIEARVPFVDHKLIEIAIALKPSDKINNGYTKYALRKTMDRKMPDSITWRKNKIGFEAPERRWGEVLNNEIKQKMSESIILKELNINTNYDLRTRYKLYSIATWEKLFCVNIS